MTVPGLVLATSNGNGLGHVTRQLAVGLAASGRARPVLFSLSTGLPAVVGLGVPGEYCPSYERGWLPPGLWDGYLRDRLLALVDETQAAAVVFDGVAPYPGLLQARLEQPGLPFVWMRRGLWRPGLRAGRLAAARLFDLVIEPGDLAAAADHGVTARRGDAVRVSPLTLLDVLAPQPRTEAARRLGLDPVLPAALVTLSAGPRSGRSARAAVRELVAAGWQVAVTDPGLAGPEPGDPRDDLPGDGRVVDVSGSYPLAVALAAFDAAVVPAGYNAVHEMVAAAVPALLVPTGKVVTDDQPLRAATLATRGLALAAAEDDPDAVARAVARLVEPDLRADLNGACRALPEHERGGGAQQAAELLLDLAGQAAARETAPAAARSWRSRPGTRLALRGRVAARRALALPPVRSAARRVGRGSVAGPARPQPAALVEEPPGTPADVPAPADGSPPVVLLTERLSAPLLRSGARLEHLLPGSAPGYRATRRAIAAQVYDLAPPKGQESGLPLER